MPGALEQKCPACGASVDVSDAEPLGRIACPQCGEKFRVERAFDHFVLLESLGVGGMGSVYKARDTRLDRLVALKLLRKDLSADPNEAARLQQEARLTASVNHPNVIHVYSSGTDHGQFYLVMELVEHGSLEDLIEHEKRVSEQQTLETGIQVARGLQAAHEKGLIHRDVKPANILFADAQTAKIGDFGLAMAAEEKGDARGEIWGTPYYVAPERLNNEPEDLRSDLFSLGATMFHAAAGCPPFEGETNSANALRELKKNPLDLAVVAPDISRPTTRIVNRMIAPDPAQRFASYAELIEQLERAHRKLLGLDKPSRRLRWILIGFALLAGIGIYFVANHMRLKNLSPAELAHRADAEALAALNGRYEDARRQLVAGKYDSARTAFARLEIDAKDRQPLLNWARLHRGLAAVLRGYSTQARTAFQEITTTGLFAKQGEDAALAKYFVDTARVLGAPAAVPTSAAAALNPKTVEAFSLFLFGAKDWQQSDFANGAAFFEQFIAASPGGNLKWINDYKPLAQKFLGDYRLYDEWKKKHEHDTTPAQISASLVALRDVAGKLQAHGALAEQLKSEQSKLEGQLGDQKKAGGATAPPSAVASSSKEKAIWDTALAAYRKQIGVYNFAGALAAIEKTPVTEAALKEQQTIATKKARWLIEWKQKLIVDLNRAAFSGTITDIGGVEYKATITAANETRVVTKLQYGVAELEWNKLSPKTLLAISNSFIAPGAADAADRRWRAAIFASETGQTEAARQLAEAAAKAKPEYRDQVRVLNLGAGATR
ncbi:MAG: eukaryotic-like serine/threonine-protein kinase [Verrucomicrobiota bacterium]|jgi:serine/threonine protein kinase